MGNIVSKLHAKFHQASLIIKRSNGRHTQVRIRISHIKKPSAWKKVAPHHSFVPQKRSDQK